MLAWLGAFTEPRDTSSDCVCGVHWDPLAANPLLAPAQGESLRDFQREPVHRTLDPFREKYIISISPGMFGSSRAPDAVFLH